MIRQSTSRVSQVLPADFAFSRVSTGYNTKGKLYMPNQLRLESSIYGGAVALVEEATTNLADSLSTWSSLNVSLDANTIIENSASGNHCKLKNIPLVIGNTYTVSCLVKPNGRNWIALGFSNLYAYFDIQNGVIGTVAGSANPKITFCDGYYKCSITYTATVSAINCYLWLASADQGANYQGNGVSGIKIRGGVQIEQKPYPTSFIETSRAAESLTMPVLATNLLTPNLASVEEGTTGFLLMGNSVLSKDTTETKCGSASLKIVTPGSAASEGFFTAATIVEASKSYTASMWLKGNGTVKIAIYERTSEAVLVGITYSDTITLTDVWTRYSVARTFGSTGVLAYIVCFTTGSTQAITFYADGLQLEPGPYATTWNLPTGELVPRMGLPVEHGTIEGIVEITDVSKRQVSGQTPAVFCISQSSYPAGIRLVHQTSAAYWVLQIYNTAYTTSAPLYDADIINGWYYYKVYWTTNSIVNEFWNLNNKIKVATTTISDLTNFPADFINMYIGSLNGIDYFANTRFGKYQLSNIARTDDPDFNNLMPRDSNTVALMDFDDITFRANQCMVI